MTQGLNKLALVCPLSTLVIFSYQTRVYAKTLEQQNFSMGNTMPSKDEQNINSY